FGGALGSGWNARDAKWSPDGTQLAFSNIVDSSLDIFVINADGSNLRQVTNYDRSEILPSWSPDGSRIAFQGFMDGTDWSHAVNTDGTDRVALNPGWRPSWAPDGAHIAFVRITGELALVNPDDGQVRVIAGAPHHMSSLAWSPDARMIAGFAPGAGIIMVDLAGGVTHLTVDGI